MANILNKVKNNIARTLSIDESRARQENKGQEIMEQLISKWLKMYQGVPRYTKDTKTNKLDGKRIKSLGAPKFVCGEMASLICNDRVEIATGNDYVDNHLSDIHYINNLQHNIDIMLGAGGICSEVWFDGEENLPKINYIKPHRFKPLTWDANNLITECELIIEETIEGDSVYRLIRRHEFPNGSPMISNELWKIPKDNSSMGKKMPLSYKYPELEESFMLPMIDKPLFVYCKPNLPNNKDLDSPLGVSIFANSLDVIASIDNAFNSLDREIELGKSRAIVPAQWLKVDEQHKAYFDRETEFYQGMNGITSDDFKMQFINPSLRVQEHIEDINFLLNMLATQTGFSTGTFSFQEGGIKTATEVVSENSKTFKTKKSHEVMVEQFVKRTIENMFALGRNFGLGWVFDENKFSISFDDSIIEDSSTVIKLQIMLVTNKMQSKLKALQIIHGISEDDAKKLLEQINEESDFVDDNGDGAINFNMGRYSKD